MFILIMRTDDPNHWESNKVAFFSDEIKANLAMKEAFKERLKSSDASLPWLKSIKELFKETNYADSWSKKGIDIECKDFQFNANEHAIYYINYNDCDIFGMSIEKVDEKLIDSWEYIDCRI